MQTLEELRKITVAQIEAYADAPDDKMSQTLILDSIDEEIRAVRAEYLKVMLAAKELLRESRYGIASMEATEQLRQALLGVSTG